MIEMIEDVKAEAEAEAEKDKEDKEIVKEIDIGKGIQAGRVTEEKGALSLVLDLQVKLIIEEKRTEARVIVLHMKAEEEINIKEKDIQEKEENPDKFETVNTDQAGIPVKFVI